MSRTINRSLNTVLNVSVYNSADSFTPDFKTVERGIFSPHALKDKQVEYNLAAFGISGIETSFALSYTYLVKAGHIGLCTLVQKFAARRIRSFNQYENGFVVLLSSLS